MNDITKKIRNYSRRQPITDKRFKFSNDLLARAAYVGNKLIKKEVKYLLN